MIGFCIGSANKVDNYLELQEFSFKTKICLKSVGRDKRFFFSVTIDRFLVFVYTAFVQKEVHQ